MRSTVNSVGRRTRARAGARRVLVLLVLAALCLGMTGAMAAEAPVELSIWSYQTSHDAKLTERIEAYMEAHPNVKINYSLVPNNNDDYWNKMAAAIASQSAPDIFYFHNQRISTFKDALAPFPEDIFPLEEMREKYYAFDASCMIDGKWYFFPMGIMDGQIYYNKQIFRDAGVPEPEGTLTWDEFRELARKLTVYDASGDIVVSGFSSKGFARFMWPDLFFQCGGTWYNEDGTEVLWDSEAGLQATQFFYDLFNVDKVDSYDFLNYDQAFPVGVAAMAHSRGFFGNNLDFQYPELEYGVMPIPVVSEDAFFLGRNNYECGFAVNNASSDAVKTEAFKFLKELYDEDYILFESTMQNRIPSLISLWDDPEIVDDPVLSISVEQAPRTVFLGDAPQCTLMAIENMLTKLYMGQNAESALKEAVQEANEGLKLTPAAWVTEGEWKQSIIDASK